MTRRTPQRPRRFGRTRRAAGFVLLEVLVSMVILGISVATMMRSFTMSLSALRTNQIVLQATVLCDQLVQDLELAPPERSGSDGTFEEQGHPQFSWSVRYTEEEPRYRSATTKNKVDLRPIRHATVKVYHDDGRRKRWAPVTVDVHLMPLERWSYQSKFFNELFREEGGRRR